MNHRTEEAFPSGIWKYGYRAFDLFFVISFAVDVNAAEQTDRRIMFVMGKPVWCLCRAWLSCDNLEIDNGENVYKSFSLDNFGNNIRIRGPDLYQNSEQSLDEDEFGRKFYFIKAVLNDIGKL